MEIIKKTTRTAHERCQSLSQEEKENKATIWA